MIQREQNKSLKDSGHFSLAKYVFISLFPAMTLGWPCQVVIWVLCSFWYNREFNYLKTTVKMKFNKFTKDCFLKIGGKPCVAWLLMAYH